MRHILAVSALLLVGAVAWPSRGTEPLLDQIALLPAAAGPELLRQCSRPTIEKPDSFWVLPAHEALAIERELVPYLDRSAIRKPSKPLQEYFRQYIGVIAQGHRLIYVSFFHRSFLEDEKDEGLARDYRDLWRTRPVVVCGGEDHYWGIVYDVDSKSFAPPEFNGPLPGA